MNEYSKRLIELNYLNNSSDCPDNIYELDKLFFDEFKVMREKSNLFFNYDNYELDIHDTYVYDLSEKRDTRGIYNIEFKIDVSVYLDKSPVDMQKIKLVITSKEKMRELNNKEIYDFMIDEDKNELNIVYFKDGRLKVLNTNYISIQKEFVPTIKNKCNIKR
jgi:subtilase family serine protease